MKKIIFTLSLVGLLNLLDSSVAMAQGKALDTDVNAEIQMDKITNAVTALPYVNMIGVSGCDPVTGLLNDFNTDYVHCIMIGVEDKAGWDSLKGIYPTGTQINKVFVDAVIIGIIGPL